MAAGIDEFFVGLLAGADLHELLGLVVIFAEVGTKAALTGVNAEHDSPSVKELANYPFLHRPKAK